jgi:hypothetical protein
VQLTRRGRLARTAALTTIAGLVFAIAVDGSDEPDGASSQQPARSVAAAVPMQHRLLPVLPEGALQPAVDQLAHKRRSHPTGKLHVVRGTGPTVGSGPLQRYRVAIEGGLVVGRHRFVTLVRDTLGDRRGWGRDLSFKRVRSGDVAFTVVLASPGMTDRLCAPMNTAGIYSCFNNGRSVINSYRWRKGAKSYGWDRHLPVYRHYVILHEIGHALGHGHLYSCRPDGKAPTMMQQTKSLYGCARNAWPYP